MQRGASFKHKVGLGRGCRHDAAIQGRSKGGIDAGSQVSILLNGEVSINLGSTFKEQFVVCPGNRNFARIETLDSVITLNRGIALEIKRIDKRVTSDIPLAAVRDFGLEASNVAVIWISFELNNMFVFIVYLIFLVRTAGPNGIFTMQANIDIGVYDLAAVLSIARRIRRFKHNVAVKNGRILAVRIDVHRRIAANVNGIFSSHCQIAGNVHLAIGECGKAKALGVNGDLIGLQLKGRMFFRRNRIFRIALDMNTEIGAVNNDFLADNIDGSALGHGYNAGEVTFDLHGFRLLVADIDRTAIPGSNAAAKFVSCADGNGTAHDIELSTSIGHDALPALSVRNNAGRLAILANVHLHILAYGINAFGVGRRCRDVYVSSQIHGNSIDISIILGMNAIGRAFLAGHLCSQIVDRGFGVELLKTKRGVVSVIDGINAVGVSPIGYRSDLVRTGQIDQTAFAANAEDRRTATELTVVVWLRRRGSSGFNIDVDYGVGRSRNVTYIAPIPFEIAERAGANACSFAILLGTRAFRRRLQLDVQSIAGDIYLSAQGADTINRLAVCSSGCEIDINFLGGNSH